MSQAETLKTHLFGEGAPVYAVIDGASAPGLLEKLDQSRLRSACVMEGELDPGMAHMAPYLVALEPEDDFTGWLLGECWGKHAGIFAIADASLWELRSHLMRLLVAYDEAGNRLFFRYYDPRVLRVYFPTCNPGELAEFFGPVRAFVAEDEKPGAALDYRNSGGKLVEIRKELAPSAQGEGA